MKELIKEVAPYKTLYRDTRSGIAWVEDGTAGVGHTCHPNIDVTGSIRGMKQLGYWRKEDRTVRSHGFIYNIDSFVVSDDLDALAAQYCRCGGRHERGRL